jgi:hypothetical protein
VRSRVDARSVTDLLVVAEQQQVAPAEGPTVALVAPELPAGGDKTAPSGPCRAANVRRPRGSRGDRLRGRPTRSTHTSPTFEPPRRGARP